MSAVRLKNGIFTGRAWHAALSSRPFHNSLMRAQDFVFTFLSASPQSPHIHSRLRHLSNSHSRLMMAACLWWFAISILHDVLLCWLCEAKTGVDASCAVSPLVGGGWRQERFHWDSQTVASRAPSPFLYIQTNSSYFSFSESWLGSQEKASLPLNPGGMGDR